MGCKTGVVVYYNERRDAFISVENETEDYYYPMRDDETLQPGDRVTFFATENLLYKRRRNAGKTMMADNVQARRSASYRGRVDERHDAVRTHRGGRTPPRRGDHHALLTVEPAVVGHFRLGKGNPRVPSSSPRASGIST